MEGDHTPNELPTSRLVVTAEELDRITAAIREGLGKGPPDGKKLLRDVLALVAGIVVLTLVYVVLTHWRPAVELSVQANALPPTAVLAFQPEDGDVGWEVGTGQVRALRVEELPPQEELGADQFTLALPIASTDCAEVATELDASCDGGVVEVRAPVTVAWSVPQVLQLVSETTPDRVSSRPEPPSVPLRLTLQRPSGTTTEATTGEAGAELAEESETTPAAPPLPQLTISDRRVTSQQWCFTYQSTSAATLSITGGSGGYQRTFEPASAPDSDCTALQLRVTPGAGTAPVPDGSQSDSATATPDAATPQPAARRPASIVTLSGISSLDVATFSRHLDVSELTGTLTVQQEDVRVFDTGTQTVFTAGEPIRSRLEIQAGTPSLTVTGNHVTSIETDRGNLVKTVWQLNPELILPIFLGLVGVLTPVLAAAYRNGVDYFASRRSRTRPSA